MSPPPPTVGDIVFGSAVVICVIVCVIPCEHDNLRCFEFYLKTWTTYKVKLGFKLPKIFLTVNH